MATTEYLGASPQIQQGFAEFWNKCRQILVQASERRQQGANNAQIQGAVAQAAQQAAAKAAAEAIDMAMDQFKASTAIADEAPEALAKAMQDQQRQG